VGNLHLPGAVLPWEQPLATGSTVPTADLVYGSQLPVSYPANLATPLNIIVEASNGASDYGKRFQTRLLLAVTDITVVIPRWLLM
jgi:phosphoribosylformylglycinamidine synthase